MLPAAFACVAVLLLQLSASYAAPTEFILRAASCAANANQSAGVLIYNGCAFSKAAFEVSTASSADLSSTATWFAETENNNTGNFSFPVNLVAANRQGCADTLTPQLSSKCTHMRLSLSTKPKLGQWILQPTGPCPKGQQACPFHILLQGRKGCGLSYLVASCRSGAVSVSSKAFTWSLEAAATNNTTTDASCAADHTPSMPAFRSAAMTGYSSYRQYLFAQSSASATLSLAPFPRPNTTVHRPHYSHQLVLTGVSPATSWFTDAPYRQAGSIPSSTFVQDFKQGFGADFPNAVLFGTLPGSNATANVIVVLCCPRYTAPDTLVYGAVLLNEPQSSNQLLYASLNTSTQVASVQAPLSLVNADLFIDNWWSNMPAGEQALVGTAIGVVSLNVAAGLYVGVSALHDYIADSGSRREARVAKDRLNKAIAQAREDQAYRQAKLDQLLAIDEKYGVTARDIDAQTLPAKGVCPLARRRRSLTADECTPTVEPGDEATKATVEDGVEDGTIEATEDAVLLSDPAGIALVLGVTILQIGHHKTMEKLDQISNELNSMAATLNSILVQTVGTANEVASMVAGTNMENALNQLSRYIDDSNGGRQGSATLGTNFQCPSFESNNWEYEFLGSGSATGLMQTLQQIICAMPNSSSVLDPPVADYCDGTANSVEAIGYFQSYFNYYQGCSPSGCTSTTASALDQSLSYLVGNQATNIVITAAQGVQLCNYLVAWINNGTNCPASVTALYPPDYCNATLSLDAYMDVIRGWSNQLVFDPRTVPLQYRMWRDLTPGSSSNVFAPNSAGLADDNQQPYYNQISPQTAYLPQGYEVCQASDYDPKTVPCNLNPNPPVWVNFNQPVVAPVGQVLTTASFTPGPNSWSCYENDGNWGCGNALNIKMQAASVTMGNGWSLALNSTWATAALPSDTQTPPAWLLDTTTIPSGCYVPPFPVSSSQKHVPYAYVPTPAQACAINPQYISLKPVMLPQGFVAVGIGMTIWSCSNYPGGVGGASFGPNPVLGLQLIGREVIVYSSGEVTWGPDVTFDNYGYCGGNVLWASAPSGNSYVTSPLSSGMYPGVNNEVYADEDNKQEYDAFQVYGNWMADNGGVDSSAWWWADEFYAGPTYTSFVQGASFWIKQNRVSVGLITTASPSFSSSQTAFWDDIRLNALHRNFTTIPSTSAIPPSFGRTTCTAFATSLYIGNPSAKAAVADLAPGEICYFATDGATSTISGTITGNTHSVQCASEPSSAPPSPFCTVIVRELTNLTQTYLYVGTAAPPTPQQHPGYWNASCKALSSALAQGNPSANQLVEGLGTWDICHLDGGVLQGPGYTPTVQCNPTPGYNGNKGLGCWILVNAHFSKTG